MNFDWYKSEFTPEKPTLKLALDCNTADSKYKWLELKYPINKSKGWSKKLWKLACVNSHFQLISFSEKCLKLSSSVLENFLKLLRLKSLS